MISFYQIAWGKILTNHRAHFKVTSTPLCKYFIYFFSHCKQTYTYTPSTSKWPASSQPLSLSRSRSRSLSLHMHNDPPTRLRRESAVISPPPLHFSSWICWWASPFISLPVSLLLFMGSQPQQEAESSGGGGACGGCIVPQVSVWSGLKWVPERG